MTNNYNKKKIFEYLDREYLAHLPDQGYGKNNKNLIIFFCKEEPLLVLFLDDFHWADLASLQL